MNNKTAVQRPKLASPSVRTCNYDTDRKKDKAKLPLLDRQTDRQTGLGLGLFLFRAQKLVYYRYSKYTEINTEMQDR